MIEINIQIGSNLAVKVVEESGMDAIRKAGFFTEVAQKCGNRRVAFFFRNPKGYEFYGMTDLDSGERLPFGQLKDKSGFFVKEWERPPARESEYDQGGHETPGSQVPPEPDDVPMHAYGPTRAAAPGASAGRPPSTHPTAAPRKF